jgi:hypothetical protein
MVKAHDALRADFKDLAAALAKMAESEKDGAPTASKARVRRGLRARVACGCTGCLELPPPRARARSPRRVASARTWPAAAARARANARPGRPGGACPR